MKKNKNFNLFTTESIFYIISGIAVIVSGSYFTLAQYLESSTFNTLSAHLLDFKGALTNLPIVHIVGDIINCFGIALFTSIVIEYKKIYIKINKTIFIISIFFAVFYLYITFHEFGNYMVPFFISCSICILILLKKTICSNILIIFSIAFIFRAYTFFEKYTDQEGKIFSACYHTIYTSNQQFKGIKNVFLNSKTNMIFFEDHNNIMFSIPLSHVLRIESSLNPDVVKN